LSNEVAGVSEMDWRELVRGRCNIVNCV